MFCWRKRKRCGRVSEKGALPLTELEPGRSALVVGVESCGKLMGRLAAMGVLPGSMVTVLSSPSGGPVMISVKGDTLCLGRSMADKILVGV